MSVPAVLMASSRIISSIRRSSAARSMMPPRDRRSSEAKERLSRTDIGSISPSVLRSSGISAMPILPLFAAWGCRSTTGLPSIRISPVRPRSTPKSASSSVALALAVEAAEADDLAGAHARSEMSRQPVGPGEVARLEHRRPVARHRHRLGREDVAVFAADHHLDHFVVGLGAGLVGRDVAAVAEDRALVGKLGDLVHAVRDVEERQAFGAQPLQHREDLGDVGGGQRRGRLVEDQDARLARQRLGDLDHLPARQRQVLDRAPADGCRRRRRGRAPPRRSALRPPVDHAEALAAGCEMTMLSATVRSGISDSSWKMQTMPAALAAAGSAKRDLAAFEASCGPRPAARRPP